MKYTVTYAEQEKIIDVRTPKIAAQTFKTDLQNKVQFVNTEYIKVVNTMGETFLIEISKLS